jgi:hypothetical protein
MSHSGTHPEYERGWDDGYDEASERYHALVVAGRALLKRWPTNKNLSEVVQNLAKELEKLPK